MQSSSAIVIIGLLVLGAGLVMPSTQTNTVEGCVEGERGVSGDGYCSGIKSTTEVTTANPAKAPTIGFGILLVLVGGVVSFGAGFEDKAPVNKKDTVLFVSSEVRDLETGETTKLGLPVHTENVDLAAERFQSTCESEGYDVLGMPNVEVKSKKSPSSDKVTECSECGAKVDMTAEYCPDCGTKTRDTPKVAKIKKVGRTYHCEMCDAKIHTGFDKCPDCGVVFVNENG